MNQPQYEHIIGVYLNTSTGVYNSNPKNKHSFIINYGIKENTSYNKEFLILEPYINIYYNYINYSEYGYSYMVERNIKNNIYTSISSLQFSITLLSSKESKVFNIKDNKDINEYKKELTTFIHEFIYNIFTDTGVKAKDFINYYNKNKNKKGLGIENNPIYFKSFFNSPYLAKILNTPNSLLNILEKESLVNIDNSYSLTSEYSIKTTLDSANIESTLSKESFSKKFKEHTNFFKLPHILRVSKTDKYKQFLASNNIYCTNNDTKLKGYKVRVGELITINDTLDKYTTTYKNNGDKCKQIIYDRPKPCKNYVNKLKEIENYDIKESLDNKYYEVFKAIVENITRDSNGELCKMYYDFVISIIAKFVREPTKLLKPDNRGLVMFQGEKNTGKSVFINILQLLFDENVYKTTQNQIDKINASDPNTNREPLKTARFITFEESIDFSAKNKELLKEFVYANEHTISVKYHDPITIKTNYTMFCAFNKDPHSVRGDIFTETGSNRRFVFCNSTVRLSDYLATKGYAMSDIDEIMNDSLVSKKAILNILANLKNENSEYSFIELDNKDNDKKENVKHAVHTTEGVLLSKLKDMNDDIMSFLSLANLPQRTINYHKLYESNPLIKIPLPLFNEYYWKEKVPKLKHREAKKTLDKVVNDNNFTNIKIVNKDNRIFITVKNNNVTKEEVFT